MVLAIRTRNLLLSPIRLFLEEIRVRPLETSEGQGWEAEDKSHILEWPNFPVHYTHLTHSGHAILEAGWAGPPEADAEMRFGM